MSMPIMGFGKGLIDTIIEILVVRENNMTPDIVELGKGC
jgi:hypothetical protein